MVNSEKVELLDYLAKNPYFRGVLYATMEQITTSKHYKKLLEELLK